MYGLSDALDLNLVAVSLMLITGPISFSSVSARNIARRLGFSRTDLRVTRRGRGDFKGTGSRGGYRSCRVKVHGP